MAIEAEYGSIFTDKKEREKERARMTSLWYPLFESFNSDSKFEKLKEMIE